MAEDLRARLAALEKEGAELDTSIKSKERETKTAVDRRNRVATLEADVSALEADVASANTKVSQMNAEVTDFPTDTQVLKLERRVQHLRDQIKDLERQKHQHRTGIEAYVSRQAESVVIRERLISTMMADLEAITTAVEAQTQKEAEVISATTCVDTIGTIVSIANQREEDLQQNCHSLTNAQSRDQELTASILAAQSKAEREGPAIEQRAEEILQRITAAWAAEKAALQKVYDKLFIINKEHRFHLARGTHVKRVNASVSHEEALSARHAVLAAQLVDLQSRLSIVTDDNKHTRKLLEKLKSDGKQAAADFELQRAEVQKRLDEAKAAHSAAVEEAYRFRSLKAELQMVLQNVRDGGSPTAGK